MYMMTTLRKSANLLCILLNHKYYFEEVNLALKLVFKCTYHY